MPGKACNDARRWRLLALEAFALAEQMTDPDCRTMMLKAGAGCDHLAELIEPREPPVLPKGSPTKP
jgi:hypothetical protein